MSVANWLASKSRIRQTTLTQLKINARAMTDADFGQLLVQAARLEPRGEREAYEEWLYNSRGDARTLGGQVTDQQGNYQAVGPFPADYAKYKYIDVTKQAVAGIG